MVTGELRSKIRSDRRRPTNRTRSRTGGDEAPRPPRPSLQLALLRAEPGFPRLQKQAQSIAHLLEDYPTIPAVAHELAFIEEVQADEWWVDVTVPMLEQMRRRLRCLVPFIELGQRTIVYSDFVDTLGESEEVALARLVAADEFDRFRRKALRFLEDHRDHLAVEKLHRNRPIAAADLVELQEVLMLAGIGTDGDVERAVEEAGGFGLFIRTVVGLDRVAAKDAFADFLDDKRYTADQIEFVNLVIDHLTERGVIEPRRLYESPFTDLSPTGPDALFDPTDVARLVDLVTKIRHNAEVAA
jgi:type I restriction enzyme R subunit